MSWPSRMIVIEERCGCGAALTLRVELDEGRASDTASRNAGRERDAWKQIDRWRRLHAECRKPAFVAADASPFRHWSGPEA